MRYLSVAEVFVVHRQIIDQSGGSPGIRDLGALHSAIAQPRQTFDGADLYPSLIDKAAVLGFTIIANHPFVDGNKRVGHAAMDIFLVLNGHEIRASVDDQEELILSIAKGKAGRKELGAWLQKHVTKT
jgi:death-on-curing protein